MSRAYNVIDSDGHVLEPPDFWADYIDPAYRDRVPELIVDTDGKERLRIEGRVLGGQKGLGFAGAIGARDGRASTDIKYTEGRKGGFDPHAADAGHGAGRYRRRFSVSHPGPFCRGDSRPPTRRGHLPGV